MVKFSHNFNFAPEIEKKKKENNNNNNNNNNKKSEKIPQLTEEKKIRPSTFQDFRFSMSFNQWWKFEII